MQFCIIYYDEIKNCILTKCTGDLKDRIGRPTENGPIIIVDSSKRYIGFFVVQGILKVLPLEYNKNNQLIFRDIYNVRLVKIVH